MELMFNWLKFRLLEFFKVVYCWLNVNYLSVLFMFFWRVLMLYFEVNWLIILIVVFRDVSGFFFMVLFENLDKFLSIVKRFFWLNCVV